MSLVARRYAGLILYFSESRYYKYLPAPNAITDMNTELVERCNVCESNRLDAVDPACHIARCANCGFVFDNPRPVLSELVKFYSRPAQYDSWLGELPARQIAWQRRLKKMQSTRKPGTLLDVGTGIGQFLEVARTSYEAVYGTEVSSVAIHIAKERYGLDVFQGTLDSIDWEGKVFDNISLFHVLEHVHDPKRLLQKCHSLLSDGGTIAVAVPNEVTSFRAVVRTWMTNRGWKDRSGLGKFGLPLISLGPENGEVHLSHFTPGVLVRLLENTGFSVLKKTLDPYYIATGLSRSKAHVYYYASSALMLCSGINVYDTIFVIARRVSTH